MATRLSEIDAKSSIKIIDVDTHLTEPPNLWLDRAPQSLKDRVPQIKEYNGSTSWMIDGDKPIGMGANTFSVIGKDRVKVTDVDDMGALNYDNIHPSSYSVEERLEEMDRADIYAQIIYPNILGFGGQDCVKVDPSLRLACVQIYNDATSELQEQSDGRLLPMALLPWWDVRQAVIETERAHRMGMRGININSDPHLHVDENGQGIPDLADPHWDPLWEICEDLGMPVNFHIGASEASMDWIGNTGWPSLHHALRGAISGTMAYVNNGRTLCNLIYSGILDRYPELTFVSVESGIGWIPFQLEMLDWQFYGIASKHTHKLQLKPSEYFKRNFYACFWFEGENICDSIKKVGVDNCMFESDFPHPTCLYPVDDLDARLNGLTNGEKKKVLSTNAAKVYNIEID